MLKLIVDCETTGLDPERHSLIEIAAQAPNGNRCTLSFRPRPGSELDPKALEVNGYHWAELDACPTSYVDGISGFFGWLAAQHPDGLKAKWTLAGMNPRGLDWPFLERAWRDAGFDVSTDARFPFGHRTLDLHSQVVLYAASVGVVVPDGGFSSESICDLLKIEREPKPHRANGGLDWEVQAFEAIGNAFRMEGRP